MALLPEVNYKDLEFCERCGDGAHGSVYRALWKSQNKVVAVKKVHSRPEKEAKILHAVLHRNIIQFFGAVTKAPDFCLVTEYAENGSLYDYLRKPEKKLEFSRILEWASDVARGMNYLHNGAPEKIIHRDLKSTNVVISSGFACKICDFGDSRFFGGTTRMTSVGTYGWMAPEVIKNFPVSDRCDVWSYGVVLWELLTREVPFKGLNDCEVGYQVAHKGLRLPISKSCPRSFADLMRQCWLEEPRKRPSFETILSKLDMMLNDVSDSLPSIVELRQEWREFINLTTMGRPKLEETKLQEDESKKNLDQFEQVNDSCSDDVDHAALSVDADVAQEQYSRATSQAAQELHYQLLNTVDDYLVHKDFSRLKAYCELWINPAQLQHITNTYELLEQLQSCGVIKVGDYHKLIKLLDQHNLGAMKEQVEKLAKEIVKQLSASGGELLPYARASSQSPTPSTLLTIDRQYRIKVPVGLALIINNQEFTDGTARDGSQVDNKKSIETLSKLGFEIRSYENLTGDQLLACFHHYGGLDLGQFSSLIAIVMSHGRRSHVYGVDRKAVPIIDLSSKFKALECPSLKEKPKGFIIVACQSDQPGISKDDLIPVEERNYVVGYSAMPGTVSFRARTGTPYMQSLMSNIDKYAQKRCLTEIMRNTAKHVHGQTPLMFSSLEKSFILKANVPGEQHCVAILRFNKESVPVASCSNHVPKEEERVTAKPPSGPKAPPVVKKIVEFTMEAPLSPRSAISMETIIQQLDTLIIRDNLKNTDVFDWIEANVSPSRAKDPQFIRALMTSVCSSAIVGEGTRQKADAKVISSRSILLQRCLDHHAELELQALYALQALVHKLKHPSGLLRVFFDTLYDEDIISEDAFKQWENSKEPSEQEGKGAASKSVVQFFTWLSEAEPEPEGGAATS